MQRYLTGKSIAQSRLGLLFNAMVKIPMQLFILFIGAMVFVVSLFTPSPAIYQPAEALWAERKPTWPAVEVRYRAAFERRREAAFALRDNRLASARDFRSAQKSFEHARSDALHQISPTFDDTNYIFLSFVKKFLPVGLIGLVIGVIFSASMGSTSGEINSLATVSVIDIYRRFLVRDRTDRHYLWASRAFTLFWGAYAVVFAAFGARGFGALIERVNIVGSLFYGGLLGVFVLAFFFRHVRGTAAFYGVLAGEAAIFSAATFTQLSFLWYNVLGCSVVVLVALLVSIKRP